MLWNSSARRPRATWNAIGFLLLLLALSMNAAPLGARPLDEIERAARNNPHTPVSNDGIVPAVGNAAQQATQLAPFRGSGALVNGGRDTANEPAVAPAPVPGQEASPESVIGPDGRVRITTTTTYPYRAIAHVTSSIGGCTGWLISDDTVATAGHCVHTGGSGGSWATNVRVYPGRNGSSLPYGSCTAARLYSVTGWTSSKNRDYDYGAIKLNCTVGNTTGWFGFRWTSSSLTGQASYIAGYPGDKTYGTLWRHNDQIRITQTRRLYYANDTAGGQSGAPVWNGTSTCNPCGIAIHAYGVDSTGYNGGTRITEAVFNNLVAWKDA